MLIRSSVLSGFRDIVAGHGGDAEALLRDVNLDGANPDSVTDLLPFATVVRLFERAAEGLGCPTLGLQLSRHQSLDKLGPMALIAMNCTSVSAAVATITTNLHTYSPAILMDLVGSAADQSTLYYNIDFATAGITSRPQMAEFSLAFAVRGLRLLAGRDFRPERVLLRHHSEADPDAYVRDFGVRPLFGQEANAIVIADHWLEGSLDLADERLRHAVDEYLAPLIGQGSLQVHRQVEHLIARLLPTGHCNLKRVARHLAMHPRTLQRQLDSTGHHFQRMVDQCRRERVRELLADPRVPLTQVAGLIGYGEQSTLTRACWRWFGARPMSVRRRLVAEA